MLGEIAAEAARRFADQLVWDGWDGSFTYAELHSRSAERSEEFASRGVGTGDVVVLRMPTCFEYVVDYVAAARLGAITAGINPKLAEAEQSALVERVTPRLVVDHPSVMPLPGRPTDFTGGPPTGTEITGEIGGAGDAADDREVAIVFTSGTTGVPKGAVFGTRQLRAIIDIDLGPGAGWGGGGPMLASTHASHVGLMTKLPWYLRSGSTLVGLERWRADDVLRAVAAHRIPTIGGVAPQIALLLRSPLLDELDLTCVKQFVVGGALSPPSLVAEVRERFGAAYSIRYSSTESGGVGLGTAFDADDEEALHTIGRPRPGVEARILDPDANGIGELQLRSAAQFSRYWGDPAATTATIDPDGWCHTGDLAQLDEAGRFRLAGRIKEMYIRGGYNVFPAEVEAVLAGHPLVAEVAVTTRPDDVLGEIGVAVVAPRDPRQPPTLESLRDFATGRLTTWKLPEALVIVDEIPRTAGDKIDRRALGRVAG